MGWVFHESHFGKCWNLMFRKLGHIAMKDFQKGTVFFRGLLWLPHWLRCRRMSAVVKEGIAESQVGLPKSRLSPPPFRNPHQGFYHFHHFIPILEGLLNWEPLLQPGMIALLRCMGGGEKTIVNCCPPSQVQNSLPIFKVSCCLPQLQYLPNCNLLLPALLSPIANLVCSLIWDLILLVLGWKVLFI